MDKKIRKMLQELIRCINATALELFAALRIAEPFM